MAGGADEGAGVGVGEWSAARDMLAALLGALGGCYWRMEVVGVPVPVVREERVLRAWESELSQAAGEQIKSGGAMVTAVNSARGVFTEIAVGRCFAIRCCGARDHETEEKMGRCLTCTRVRERLEALWYKAAGRQGTPFAPSLRLLGNAMQVKAGTARPGQAK